MESHEVLRDAFERTSPKEVASELGLSLSMVYKWAQPQSDQGSGSQNPLDRCAQLIRLTRDPKIVQWLCGQANGFFVRNPKPKNAEEHSAVLPAMNEIVQQFADLLEAITKAALDNHISKDEAERIRLEWEDLKTFAETFVHACEKGDFTAVKTAALTHHTQQPR